MTLEKGEQVTSLQTVGLAEIQQNDSLYVIVKMNFFQSHGISKSYPQDYLRSKHLYIPFIDVIFMSFNYLKDQNHSLFIKKCSILFLIFRNLHCVILCKTVSRQTNIIKYKQTPNHGQVLGICTYQYDTTKICTFSHN